MQETTNTSCPRHEGLLKKYISWRERTATIDVYKCTVCAKAFAEYDEWDNHAKQHAVSAKYKIVSRKKLVWNKQHGVEQA